MGRSVLSVYKNETSVLIFLIFQIHMPKKNDMYRIWIRKLLDKPLVAPSIRTWWDSTTICENVSYH